MAIFYTVRQRSNAKSFAMYGEEDEQIALAIMRKMNNEAKIKKAAAVKKYGLPYTCVRHRTDGSGEVVSFTVWNIGEEKWGDEWDVLAALGEDERSE